MTITDILGLVGGLALFLYGMRMMGEGLELIAGSRLKTILEKLTRNRFLGMLVGLGLTALIQSSNAMTAMTVGFVNAGLMDFSQAIGVIMGSNIGTTVTGQLIALKITAIAPVFAFAGVVMFLFIKKKKPHYIGQVLAGLGILFMGMNFMSSSMAPLQDVLWFQELIISLRNPLLGVLAGTVFTLLVQSSSASIGVLQAMAMQGVIGLDSAIFVLCGQNIGCTIAAIMAAIGGNKNARRTALVHLLFNVTGTTIFVIAAQVMPLVPWIESLTPNNGVAQIANAHTIFNIATTALLLPCAELLKKVTMKLIPGTDETDGPRLMHITDLAVGAASLGIAQIDAEVNRMQSLADTNLHAAKDALFGTQDGDIEQIEKNEEIIDYLNKEITNALVRVNAMELTENDARHISALYHVLKDLERIGDHAENIAGYAQFNRERGKTFSVHAQEELSELCEMVNRLMRDSYAHFLHPEKSRMSDLEALEQQIDDLVERLQNNHITRLNAQKCTAEIGMIYVEVLTDLERVADHALNIAQAVKGKYAA